MYFPTMYGHAIKPIEYQIPLPTKLTPSQDFERISNTSDSKPTHTHTEMNVVPIGLAIANVDHGPEHDKGCSGTGQTVADFSVTANASLNFPKTVIFLTFMKILTVSVRCFPSFYCTDKLSNFYNMMFLLSGKQTQLNTTNTADQSVNEIRRRSSNDLKPPLTKVHAGP